MAGINGSFGSLLFSRMLENSTRSLFTSLERLSTGKRINRGSDDPAGLISSENLRAAVKALESDIRVFERADHMATVADGGLEVASSLLAEAQGLVVANASDALSDEEKQANQLALDSIMATIDRVTGGTEFNGKKLLDGSATIQAGEAEHDLASAHTSDLGEVEIDGETYTLSDLEAGGDLNIVDGDLTGAQQAIDQAITDVTTARGSLGAFQRNEVQAGIESRRVAMETTSAAYSIIADTDFAAEITRFHRAQVQFQASLMAVSFTEQARSSVLRLLSGVNN
ncbi:MAG: flagellin [Planctomycetota bacterium]|jgi:flagellin